MSTINSVNGMSISSQRKPADPLPMTVLICTRNRGDSLVPTVRSILSAETTCAELLILDQSPDETTKLALAPFADHPCLRYVQTASQGKGLALNEGLRIARYEFVAITDDDCEVAPDWLQPHMEAFLRYPDMILTYGNVLPVEHDPIKGFIPTYYVPRDLLVTNIWQKLPARGIGANTAVRRKEILALGGFDTELCPGGIFKACVDRDMTIRCILRGYHVFESRDSKVYHYGFRNWVQGKTLACNAFYGIGAAHIKAVKCGYPGAIVLLLWELMAYALLPSFWSQITLQRPYGWNRVIYFARGMAAGWKFPIDKEHMTFKNQEAQEQSVGSVESEAFMIR